MLARWIAGVMLVAMAVYTATALAKTRWPYSDFALQPDESTSSVKAPLPPHIIQTAEPDMPADMRAWAGRWRGSGGYGAVVDVKLVVESVSNDGATIIHAAAKESVWTPFSERIAAKWDDGELVAQMRSGAWLTYRFRGLHEIEIFFRNYNTGGWYIGALERDTKNTGQVIWPPDQESMRIDMAQIAVPAEALDDVVITPAASDVPASLAALSGRWKGWSGRNRDGEIRLAINVPSKDTAEIVYSFGSTTARGRVRCSARFNGQEATCVVPSGNAIALRARPDGNVDYLWTAKASSSWAVGLLAKDK